MEKSSRNAGEGKRRGHPEGLGLVLGLGTVWLGVRLTDPVGVTVGVGDVVGVGDRHTPLLTSTDTVSMPRAAVSWSLPRAQVMVMVAVEEEWGRVTSTTRWTSSPALAAMPRGFWGAPQPPPRDVTPLLPLLLSYVPTTTPSTVMV